jgi:hypothetical protein
MWSSAVQTACQYCKAILVRNDVNIENVGEVADLPRDASPIQILTEGIFDNRRFMVIGRLVYEWEQGGWNEWHIAFDDGRSAWLSDAQAEYAISFHVAPQGPLPPMEQARRGLAIQWGGLNYIITHRTEAAYVGFEGELPFRTTDRSRMVFADLRTPDARFGTIDYSETPPLLYMGRQVDFDELKLRNLRMFEGW